MTDFELERACGEAMGYQIAGGETDAFLWIATTGDLWIPLGDGHQAMQLVARFHLHIDQRPGKQISVQPPDFSEMVLQEAKKGHELNLNRAIVECVALMHRKGLA